MGFPACFSLPTPTAWAFKLRFLLSRPVSSPLLAISFRNGFFCLLLFQKAHAVCFLTSNLAFSHTFPFSTCQSASGLCFSAYFSFRKHMPCVFWLQFSSFHTLFLLYLPISFRFVLFCLLFFQKAHAVCFLTSILAFIYTFLFSTCQSTSGLCFLACFPHPTHNKTRAAVHPPLSYHFPRVQVRSSSRCSYPAPAPRIP